MHRSYGSLKAPATEVNDAWMHRFASFPIYCTAMDSLNGSNMSTYEGGGGKDFEKLASSIGTSIQKVSQNVSSMNRMVQQLSTQFSQDLYDKYYQIQHYTNQLASDTRSQIEELRCLPPPSNTVLARQQKLRSEDLLKELLTSLSVFKEAQSKAVRIQKEELKQRRAHLPLNPPPSGDTKPLVELDVRNERKLAAQNAQLQMQEELDLNELRVKERHLLQLEEDVQCLNQTFIDLGKLVHDQGSIVESIEGYLQMTESRVESGSEALRVAHQRKNKIVKKKICLWSTLVIVLLVTILLIWAFA